MSKKMGGPDAPYRHTPESKAEEAERYARAVKFAAALTHEQIEKFGIGLEYVHSVLRWAACGYVNSPERIAQLHTSYRIVDKLVNAALAAPIEAEAQKSKEQWQAEATETLERLDEKAEERRERLGLAEAQKAAAWMFECRKPGKSIQYASIEEKGTEHWPVDQWTSIVKTPLYTHPASSASTEVVGRRESDQQLMDFYSVETIPALIDAQERHIAKLQAKLPPLRDEQPRNPRIG